MVLAALGIILALLIVLTFVSVIVALVAPLTVRGSYSNRPGAAAIDLTFSWLVIKGHYEPAAGGIVITIANRWRRTLGGGGGESGAEQPSSRSGADHAHQATPQRAPAPSPVPASHLPDQISPSSPPASQPSPPEAGRAATGVSDAQSAASDERQASPPPDAPARSTGSPGPSDAPIQVPPKDDRPRETIRERMRRSKAWFFVSNRQWRWKIWRWTRRSLAPVLRMASLQSLLVQLRMNLDDPAETAQTSAYLNALHHALLASSRSPIAVHFEPVFDRPCAEVSVHGAIESSLARLSWPLVVAFVTFPYLSTYRVNKEYRRIMEGGTRWGSMKYEGRSTK